MDFMNNASSLFVACWYFPFRWKQWYRRAKEINGVSVYVFIALLVFMMYHIMALLAVRLTVKDLFLVNDHIVYTWMYVFFTNIIALVISYIYAALFGYHEMAWSLPLWGEEQRAKMYQECDPTITARDVMEHNWCIFEWYMKHKFPNHIINPVGVAILCGTPDEIYQLPFKEWLEEVRKLRPNFDGVDQCERTLYKRERSKNFYADHPEVFKP